jgi:hypothetical protein
MRRIQRHMPDAKIIATFWNLPGEKNEVSQTMGCEVATELEKAVEAIIAADMFHSTDNRSAKRPPAGSSSDSGAIPEESRFSCDLAAR